MTTTIAAPTTTSLPLNAGEKELLTLSLDYLFAMKKRAGFILADRFTCAYRGESCNCVVGNLITDEAYDPRIEGRNVHAYRVREAVRLSHPDKILSFEFFDMLRYLQYAHDRDENWDGDVFKPTASAMENINRVRARLV